MKRSLIAGLILIVLISLCGCHNEPDSKLERRLNAFLEILDKNTRMLFDAKRYASAASLFQKKMDDSKQLRDAFRRIRDRENVLFFSTEQVFRFFGDTMRNKIRFFRNIKHSKKI